MLPPERVRHEERLRGAVLAGDQAAWRTLYDGAFTELWNYVLWRCAGLHTVAEEIVQDTWLVAVRRIADFDPAAGPFLAWLRGIAANQLRNHFRAVRRRPQTQADFAEPSHDDREQREQAELIAAALAELPERSEDLLRAKYLDLMSVEQIAAEWDETPKAIESLLTRARQAFRTAYEKRAGIDVAFKERKP
jgi:RNA polymerase sigma-70 factor (ECF subfamily)